MDNKPYIVQIEVTNEDCALKDKNFKPFKFVVGVCDTLKEAKRLVGSIQFKVSSKRWQERSWVYEEKDWHGWIYSMETLIRKMWITIDQRTKLNELHEIRATAAARCFLNDEEQY